jgi:hypothetical protein
MVTFRAMGHATCAGGAVGKYGQREKCQQNKAASMYGVIVEAKQKKRGTGLDAYDYGVQRGVDGRRRRWSDGLTARQCTCSGVDQGNAQGMLNG